MKNKNKNIVLAFHRILPEKLISKTSGYYAKKVLISQEYFERVISYLHSEGYKFKTVTDLINNPDNEKNVALTFDDGYSDNYEYALPVLRKYKVTATFYPVAKVCRDNTVLPIDIYYQIIDSLNLTNRERKEYYFGDVRRQFYWAEPNEQMNMLRKMFNALPEKYNVSYMSAEQIKQLAVEGFEIGSHTMTHSLLTAKYMTDDKINEEMKGSKQWFENVTGKPVVSFCFPAGKYNAKLISMAAENGYTSTCLVGRDAKLLEAIPSFPRINVSPGSLIKLEKEINNYQNPRKGIKYYYKNIKYRLRI